MALYMSAVATPAAAAGAPFALIAAGTGTRIKIREIGFFCNAATATTVGITRASNTAVPTTSQVGQPYDVADATSTGAISTAWSTAPTANSAYLRRIPLPAAIGAGIIYVFDDLIVGVLGVASLVLWNLGAGAGSVLQLYTVWEE